MTVTRDIAGVAEEEQRIYNMLEQTDLAAGDNTTVPTQPNYLPTQANYPVTQQNYQPQSHSSYQNQAQVNYPPTPTNNAATSANYTPIRNHIE